MDGVKRAALSGGNWDGTAPDSFMWQEAGACRAGLGDRGPATFNFTPAQAEYREVMGDLVRRLARPPAKRGGGRFLSPRGAASIMSSSRMTWCQGEESVIGYGHQGFRPTGQCSWNSTCSA